MKIMINNVSLEFDIFDADNADLFQAETEKVIKAAEISKQEKQLGNSIRIQCKSIFDFIDALFGAGVHNKIFGNEVNLREALSVYKQINNAVLKSKNELMSLTPERASVPNRQQRRHNKHKKH